MLFKEHEEGEVLSAVKEAVSTNVSSSEAVEQLLTNRTAPQDDFFLLLQN